MEEGLKFIGSIILFVLVIMVALSYLTSSKGSMEWCLHQYHDYEYCKTRVNN